MSTNNKSEPHILIIPFPAQGHLIPLLELAHLLSLRHIAITIVVTPLNLPLLSPLLSSSPSIQPLILDFPNYPSLPSHAQHMRSLPSKSSIASLVHALSFLSPQILSWVHNHPSRGPPTALLSDFFLGWTHQLAKNLNIPRFAFFSSGALLVSLFHYLFLNGPHDVSPTLPSFPYHHLPSLFRRYHTADKAAAAAPEWDFVRESMIANSSNHAAVLNTFDALESKYLTHLQELYGHDRVWAVGPIGASIPGSGDRGGKSSVPPEEVLTWLDTCPERSVVHVCFGSQFQLTGPHAHALAAALRLSGARFVWCVGPTGLDDEEGFGDRGLVIRGWAPQVEILGHRSVGSFLTHCGWNSVLEGIVNGVVLLTWPMEADQFVNARLLVEEMGMAVRACEGGPEVVPEVEELARVVKESVDGGMWKEVKMRAEEMGRLAAAAVGDGGSSRRDLEELVKEFRVVED